MEALIEIGYRGHVGQEFIPTHDPLVGLREAVVLCATCEQSYEGASIVERNSFRFK